MKRTILKLLAVCIALSVSIGSTIAYLTDSDGDVNVMTLGRVEIDLIEQERNTSGTLVPFQDDKPIIPGVYPTGMTFGNETDFWSANVYNTVDKVVTVKNTGNSDAYIRVWFAFEATSRDFFDQKIHLNKNDVDWDWTFLDGMLSQNNTNYVVAVATYKNILPNGSDDINTTSASLRQVLLGSTATNEDVAALGEKYGIFVVAQAVQAQGFDDATTALDAGFSAVEISKHPFADMKEEDNPNTPTMPDIPETPSSDFTWEATSTGNEFVITGYTGTATQVKVPQTINGKPVTQIDKNAFANKSDLTHVVLPEGVTSIGTRAFEGCTNLECINIPSTVQSIGAYAFTECDSLTSIAFPAGITIIPEGVCAGCDELTTVTMSEDVTNIGKKAFYRCNKLESMTSD